MMASVSEPALPWVGLGQSLRKEAGNPQLHSCHQGGRLCLLKTVRGHTQSTPRGVRGRACLESASPSSARCPLKLSVCTKEVCWELCPGRGGRRPPGTAISEWQPLTPPQLARTHVHRVGNTIQPSHVLSSPSIFPAIRVFSSESALRVRRPKYWSFTFSISPSNEYSGLTLGLVLGLTLRPDPVLTCAC